MHNKSSISEWVIIIITKTIIFILKHFKEEGIYIKLTKKKEYIMHRKHKNIYPKEKWEW